MATAKAIHLTKRITIEELAVPGGGGVNHWASAGPFPMTDGVAGGVNFQTQPLHGGLNLQGNGVSLFSTTIESTDTSQMSSGKASAVYVTTDGKRVQADFATDDGSPGFGKNGTLKYTIL